MPTNKNAIARLKYLDELLQDRHHYYDIHDLTDKCNERLYDAGLPEVTQRCIEKDINFLEFEPFNADIERFWKNGRSIIRYENPSFSIFQKELTDEEMTLLAEVLNTLGQFEGLASLEWLDRLRVGFRLKTHRKIISFSNNPRLQNSNLLGTIFELISNKVVIKLKYQKFGHEEPREHIVHPYLLKQYNERWFLLAATDKTNKLLTFALDRIKNITPMPEAKYRPCNENLDKQFVDIVGVTLFNYIPMKHILFWASNSAKDYVITKPIHRTQKQLKAEQLNEMQEKYHCLNEGAFFTIDCKPNYELVRELSSYGKEIVVLQPIEVKDLIIDQIKDMLSMYSILPSDEDIDGLTIV